VTTTHITAQSLPSETYKERRRDYYSSSTSIHESARIQHSVALRTDPSVLAPE
jgi:hypothetical protein